MSFIPPLLAALLLSPTDAPPPLAAPEDAVVLFDGGDLSAWRSLDETGHPLSEAPPRWTTAGGALVADPAAGDLLTRRRHGDYHLHLDFLLPAGVEPGRGASVLLSGRYGVRLTDSLGQPPSEESCGAIHALVPPRVDAANAAGVWQRLDVTFVHDMGELPRVSVWLNDVLVQHDVDVPRVTPGGFTTRVPGSTAEGEPILVAEEEVSRACDWGRPRFAVEARFRSRGSGTLASKCPPEGEWKPNAKALFLRGGRLVYDIGWVGALTSGRSFTDGEWHHVVLTSDDGTARLWVDGELEGERADFAAPDEDGFVLKLGAANENFAGPYEGALGAVRFFAGPLSPEEARGLSEGHSPARVPAFEWSTDVEPTGLGRGDALAGPIRLQADAAGVRFANVWVRPLGDVDHAGLLDGWGPEAYLRGASIYRGLCVSCHGKDGDRAPNPRARPFARGALKNGRDPLRLFETITGGYGEMPGNAWLTPAERYDVIHYLREAFLRERNEAEYFEVTDAWKNTLPKGRTARADRDDDLPVRDFGPCLATQLGDDIGSGLTVKLDDDTSFAYDLQTMESPGAWTGGFLDLRATQHHQQRGEGRARPQGDPIPGLDAWGWGHDGTLDWDRARRPPRGPLPREWLDHHGHYLHERSVVLSYAIDGRDVLEVPSVDRSAGLPVVTHRLRVAPGEQELVLGVVRPPDGPGEKVWTTTATWTYGDDRWLKLVALERFSSHDFAAAAVVGDLAWEIDDAGRAVLRFPPSSTPTEVYVVRTGGRGEDALRGFQTFLENLRERPLPPSPAALVEGGPSRWPTPLVTKGRLGEGPGAYALDTVEVPVENEWNAWVRTSALDFFEDGRAAVSTYGGDVWIVSGLDDDLDEVTWRRFAAGMFEPMGVKVVDGKVLVTCRDRITRLHDLNGDGEADFYESFFADPDVSPNFHAFNFDLQEDARGHLYYAKSGQYTDFDLPGAILDVAPDGESFEVFCTGLRTPNGMGMSPDGRPLVSDNQGNWIPASKVTLTERDGFYGVFEAIETSSPGIQDRETFDPPVVWMPQSVDSSSGGQLWVDDPRFGPLAGRYLHTSFGKGWMYGLTIDESVAPAQGAVWRLPFQFDAGIMRLRTNPADGQVWATGLSGWQGPESGEDGCLQRVRYTGAEDAVLQDARVVDGRVRLTFSGGVDRTAAEPDRWNVRRWNYRWARSYGSDHWSVSEPGQRGEDTLRVTDVRLDDDGRVVTLGVDDLRPCHQLAVTADLVDASGAPLDVAVYLTLHAVPGTGQVAEPMRTEDPWVVYEGEEGPGKGKHVVFVTGDEEYRSEEAMPQLARILAERHGFKCTVLFSIDGGGAIDPQTVDDIPGLAALDDADLMVIFTRFRDLPDRQMKHVVDYVESGRPIVGLRTATHAFNLERHETYKRYSFRGGAWDGGFGRQVLGETWVDHHGGHGSQCTRGLLAEEHADHPILRGLRDGDVWDPSDVYTVRLPMMDGITPLVLGEVVDGMKPDDPPLAPRTTDDGRVIDKNDPMMPVAWVREWEAPSGQKARVFTTTTGTSQALLAEGTRRLYVNACLWAVGLEDAITGDLDVGLVGEFDPTPFGFGRHERGVRPAELKLADG